MSSRSMLPPDPTRRRLRRFHDFEAATGLQRPLSTLHERRCRRPCKTCFRLAGSAFAGRASNPLGRFERFQVTSILLSRAYPDASWAHARRPFFAMADIEENARRKAAGKKEIPLSPIAIEVRRIDALFAIERSINGKSPEERLAVRRAISRPRVDDLMAYMREQAAKLSRGHDLARAIQYMLKRWSAFTLFLDDGRVCMSTDDAEKRESSARRSGLGRSLGRLFLPRHHHPLVGLLGTPNVVGFSLSDLLEPIVATWSRLAIFAWSAGLERSFA